MFSIKAGVNLLLFFSVVVSAQNSFQKAKYVDPKGVTIEGYIYNLDWMDNPISIEFKSSLESSSRIISIDDIQEFEIIGVCKYIKFEGLIDQSSRDLNYLDSNRNPKWKSSKVLLKVLLESDASLFYYSNGMMNRYFYSVESRDIKIQQLVFKEYFKNGNKAEQSTNFEFRQQLFSNLVCENITKNKVSTLKYNAQDLIHFFTIYNLCKNKDQTDFTFSKKRNVHINFFALGAGSGVVFQTKSNYPYVNENQLHKFDAALYYKFGGEVELILPVNNNKWSLFFQPTFQVFGSKSSKPGVYNELKYSIDYHSLNLPVGLRHYMYINSKSKMYLNASIGFNFDMGSKVILGNDENFSFFDNSLVKAIGFGFVFKDKICLELRYNNSSDCINDSSIQSKIEDFGIVFRYKLN